MHYLVILFAFLFISCNVFSSLGDQNSSAAITEKFRIAQNQGNAQEQLEILEQQRFSIVENVRSVLISIFPDLQGRFDSCDQIPTEVIPDPTTVAQDVVEFSCQEFVIQSGITTIAESDSLTELYGSHPSIVAYLEFLNDQAKVGLANRFSLADFINSVQIDSIIGTIDSIRIEGISDSIQAGDMVMVMSEVFASSEEITTEVEWSSSNESILTVSSTGVVVGINEGVAQIIAASVFDPTRVTAVMVVVTAQDAVVSIEFDLDTLRINEGEIAFLTPTIVTTGVISREIIWNVANSSIVEVTQSGVVSAIRAGEATVRATSVANPTISGSLFVQVINVLQLESFSITPINDTLNVNETLRFETVFEGVENPPVVRWSTSNLALATIDALGTLTALREGVVSVLAVVDTNNNFSTSAQIVIQNPEGVVDTELPVVLSFSGITPPSAVVFIGDFLSLTANIEIQGGASSQVNWSSENQLIATVNQQGIVEGRSTGNTTITAVSIGNPLLSATALITVILGASVLSVDIPENLSYNVGDSQLIQVTITRSLNADNRVFWHSSNTSIFTVDSIGFVTAVGEGQAILTVTSVFDLSVTDSATVTVIEVPRILSVRIFPDTNQITIALEEQLQLVSDVSRVGEMSLDVNWTSSNSDVASVSSNGIVTGLEIGLVTIMAVSDIDSTQQDQITVIVGNENSIARPTENRLESILAVLIADSNGNTNSQEIDSLLEEINTSTEFLNAIPVQLREENQVLIQITLSLQRVVLLIAKVVILDRSLNNFHYSSDSLATYYELIDPSFQSPEELVLATMIDNDFEFVRNNLNILPAESQGEFRQLDSEIDLNQNGMITSEEIEMYVMGLYQIE